MVKELIININTTDFCRFKVITDSTIDKFPHLVEFATLAGDRLTHSKVMIPDGAKVSPGALEFHGLDGSQGITQTDAINLIYSQIQDSDIIIGHNLDFILLVLNAISYRKTGKELDLEGKKVYCTMRNGIDICKLPSHKADEYKFPTLVELVKEVLGEDIIKPVFCDVAVREVQRVYEKMSIRG